MIHDPASNFAAFSRPTRHFDVAVIGAGSAGCAAAIAAARSGASTLLIDEHPVPSAQMGADVPLRFGGRFDAAVRSPERLIEHMALSDPGIAAAFDAGVDVRLGTAAWGAWLPGPAMQALPGRMLGLVAGGVCSIVGFDRLVIATGARDLALGFDGADLPGVVGVRGMQALATRYGAFTGRRVVVVGDTEPDLPGIEIVEHLRLADGWVPLRAEGGTDGVNRLVLTRPDGTTRAVECDTICLAIGLVPTIELAAVLGCALTYDPMRGGHVPLLDAAGQTSIPGVSVVGDAAGTAPDDRLDWMRALLATGGPSPMACLCEDVSRADFASLHPPRYLGSGPGGQAAIDPGRTHHPDHAKRLTRAGMGLCQGRRCREQLAMLLALDNNAGLETIPLASYRMPLRPLPLSALANLEERANVSENWPVWFGHKPMWEHWRDIAP